MKIAQIGQKKFPGDQGGIEKHVEEISKSLAKKGHEILIYVRNNTSLSSTPNNITLKPVFTVKRKHFATFFQVLFASLKVIFERVDIIHYHGIGPAFFSFIPSIFKPKAKIVVTAHCPDYQHGKWKLPARLFLKAGERIGVTFADKIIAVSPVYKRFLESKYHKKVSFIPNGAKILPKEDSKLIEQWNLHPNQYFLTVNRLVSHKDIHVLIKAFKKANTNKKLVITGGSSFTDNYKKRLKNLSSDNEDIIFTGIQKGQNLTCLFQNAFLFIQPSQSEGLSTVIIEAMAAGTPVLASDIPANNYLTGQKTGFTFQKGNVKQLKKALEKISTLPPEIINKRKNKAKKRVEKNFTWSKVGTKTEKVYKTAKGSASAEQISFNSLS